MQLVIWHMPCQHTELQSNEEMMGGFVVGSIDSAQHLTVGQTGPIRGAKLSKMTENESLRRAFLLGLIGVNAEVGDTSKNYTAMTIDYPTFLARITDEKNTQQGVLRKVKLQDVPGIPPEVWADLKTVGRMQIVEGRVKTPLAMLPEQFDALPPPGQPGGLARNVIQYEYFDNYARLKQITTRSAALTAAQKAAALEITLAERRPAPITPSNTQPPDINWAPGDDSAQLIVVYEDEILSEDRVFARRIAQGHNTALLVLSRSGNPSTPTVVHSANLASLTGKKIKLSLSMHGPGIYEDSATLTITKDNVVAALKAANSVLGNEMRPLENSNIDQINIDVCGNRRFADLMATTLSSLKDGKDRSMLKSGIKVLNRTSTIIVNAQGQTVGKVRVTDPTTGRSNTMKYVKADVFETRLRKPNGQGESVTLITGKNISTNAFGVVKMGDFGDDVNADDYQVTAAIVDIGEELMAYDDQGAVESGVRTSAIPDAATLKTFADDLKQFKAAQQSDREAITQAIAAEIGASDVTLSTLVADSVTYDESGDPPRRFVNFRARAKDGSEIARRAEITQELQSAAIKKALIERYEAVRTTPADSGDAGLGAALSVMGFVGAARALQRGDEIDGLIALAGAATPVAGAAINGVQSATAKALGNYLLASLDCNDHAAPLSRALREGTNQLKRVGNALQSIAQAGERALPYIGTALAGTTAFQDLRELSIAGWNGNAAQAAASALNFVFDGFTAVADTVPGGAAIAGPVQAIRALWEPVLQGLLDPQALATDAREFADSASSSADKAAAFFNLIVHGSVAALPQVGPMGSSVLVGRDLLTLTAESTRQGEALAARRTAEPSTFVHTEDNPTCREYPSEGDVSVGDIFCTTQDGVKHYFAATFISTTGTQNRPLPTKDSKGNWRTNIHWTYLGTNQPVSRSQIANFSGGVNSFHAGYLDVWLDGDGKSAKVHTGTSASQGGSASAPTGEDLFPAMPGGAYQTVQFGDKPVDQMVMGGGATFRYEFANRPVFFYAAPFLQLPLANLPVINGGSARRDSLESHYHAANGRDITFIAPADPPKMPPGNPLNERYSIETEAQTIPPEAFKYVMYGATGEESTCCTSTFVLGTQQAEVHCGSGKNIISVPWDYKTFDSPGFTVDIDEFRADGSCMLKLNGTRIDSSRLMVRRTASNDIELQFGKNTIVLHGMADKSFSILTDTGVFTYRPALLTSNAVAVRALSCFTPLFIYLDQYIVDAKPNFEWFKNEFPAWNRDPTTMPVTFLNKDTDSVFSMNWPLGRTVRNPTNEENVEQTPVILTHRLGGNREAIVAGGSENIELTVGPHNPNGTMKAGSATTTFDVKDGDGQVRIDNSTTRGAIENHVRLNVKWIGLKATKSGSDLVISGNATQNAGVVMTNWFDSHTDVRTRVQNVDFVSSDGVCFSISFSENGASGERPDKYYIKSFTDADALPHNTAARPHELDLGAAGSAKTHTQTDDGFKRLTMMSGSDNHTTNIAAPPGTNSMRMVGGAAGGALVAASGPTIFEIPAVCMPGATFTIDNTAIDFNADYSNLLILHGVPYSQLTGNNAIQVGLTRILTLNGSASPKIALTSTSSRLLRIRTSDGVLCTLEPNPYSEGNYIARRIDEPFALPPSRPSGDVSTWSAQQTRDNFGSITSSEFKALKPAQLSLVSGRKFVEILKRLQDIRAIETLLKKSSRADAIALLSKLGGTDVTADDIAMVFNSLPRSVYFGSEKLDILNLLPKTKLCKLSALQVSNSISQFSYDQRFELNGPQLARLTPGDVATYVWDFSVGAIRSLQRSQLENVVFLIPDPDRVAAMFDELSPGRVKAIPTTVRVSELASTTIHPLSAVSAHQVARRLRDLSPDQRKTLQAGQLDDLVSQEVIQCFNDFTADALGTLRANQLVGLNTARILPWQVDATILCLTDDQIRAIPPDKLGEMRTSRIAARVGVFTIDQLRWLEDNHKFSDENLQSIFMPVRQGDSQLTIPPSNWPGLYFVCNRFTADLGDSYYNQANWRGTPSHVRLRANQLNRQNRLNIDAGIEFSVDDAVPRGGCFINLWRADAPDDKRCIYVPDLSASAVIDRGLVRTDPLLYEG